MSGPVQAGEQRTATASATIQPGGPRKGDAGKTYWNIEGKNNGENSKYASFGVVDFTPTKSAAGGKLKSLTLTLTQSVPGFAKDGKLKFFLSGDTKTSIEPPADDQAPALKFDVNNAGGLAWQLVPLIALGNGAFKKVDTGHIESFTFALSPEAEAFLRSRLESGEKVRLVIAADDDDVAATYFGAGAETEANRPRLSLE
jgi:hypothetical protein